MTLCNNYRCHADLLKLSSNLFYESSLVACGKIDIVAPYSLQFICSSLEKNPASFSDKEIEAKIIIKEVENLLCTNKKLNASNVCIMSPSQRQVYINNICIYYYYRQNNNYTHGMCGYRSILYLVELDSKTTVQSVQAES